MPLYEYRCPNGHDFEKFYRSIGTASTEATCPVCGAFGARVMSTAGLVFKGSGFYITDYGKDGKKAERDAVTAEKKKTDSAAAATTAKAAEAASAGSAASSGDAPSAAKSKDPPAAASKPASTPAPAAPASTTKTST